MRGEPGRRWRSTKLRLDRAWGELGDWHGLVAWLLGASGDAVILDAGPAGRLLVWLCRAEAVTVGRSVFFSRRGWLELERRSRKGLVLLAHELAHVDQYRRRGLLAFLAAYLGEYLEGRRRSLSHRQAYLEISFEREARLAEAAAARLLDSGALFGRRSSGG